MWSSATSITLIWVPINQSLPSARCSMWGYMAFTSLRRFNFRGHAALAARHQRVGAKGVDLVAFEFGAFQRSRIDDHASLQVHLFRHLETLLGRMAEER